MTKTLSQILHRPFDADPAIAGVTADSRKVREGFLFAALPLFLLFPAGFALVLAKDIRESMSAAAASWRK